MTFIASSVKGFRKPVASKNPEFTSLKDYLQIAEKQISHFGKRFEVGFTKKMLNSEEAISFVAYANMIADWKYDPNKNMTRHSYRNNYAWYYILYIHKKWSNKLEIVESDLQPLNEEITPNSIIESVAPSQMKSPLYELIDNEEKEKINDIMRKKLPDRDRKIFNMYITEDSNLSNIGRIFGLSRERVRQIVNKATKIVENEANE